MFRNSPGLADSHTFRNPSDAGPKSRPVIGAQDDQGNTPVFETLLVFNALIGGDHDFKAKHLGCCDQIAVSQNGPALRRRALDLVPLDELSQTYRDIVVEQDLHATNVARWAFQ